MYFHNVVCFWFFELWKISQNITWHSLFSRCWQSFGWPSWILRKKDHILEFCGLQADISQRQLGAQCFNIGSWHKCCVAYIWTTSLRLIKEKAVVWWALLICTGPESDLTQEKVFLTCMELHSTGTMKPDYKDSNLLYSKTEWCTVER